MIHMGDDFSRMESFQKQPKTTSVKCEVCGKIIKDVPAYILLNDSRKLCEDCFCEDFQSEETKDRVLAKVLDLVKR